MAMWVWFKFSCNNIYFQWQFPCLNVSCFQKPDISLASTSGTSSMVRSVKVARDLQPTMTQSNIQYSKCWLPLLMWNRPKGDIIFVAGWQARHTSDEKNKDCCCPCPQLWQERTIWLDRLITGFQDWEVKTLQLFVCFVWFIPTMLHKKQEHVIPLYPNIISRCWLLHQVTLSEAAPWRPHLVGSFSWCIQICYSHKLKYWEADLLLEFLREQKLIVEKKTNKWNYYSIVELNETDILIKSYCGET